MTGESQRRVDWLATGILLVSALILFAPALSHPDSLLYPTFSPYSDVTVIHWPKAHLMAKTWQAAHTLPLWTPANLSGMPLAANPLAMRFYPPAWLFLFLPLNLAFNLLFVFHLFWGGLGVYRLLRAGFDLSPIPALAGALTFSLGGKLLAHTAGGHVSMVGAVAWMPWAVLGTHQLLRTRSFTSPVHFRWAILAAVALAMQITTHTMVTIYTGYFLAAYAVWQFAGSKFQIPNLKYRFLALLSIPVLAGLLGAAQLLPLAELAGYSNRALSLAQAGDFALKPLTLLVGLLLPSAGGGHEMVIYLGLVPLLLALFGLSRAATYPANQQRGTGRINWFFVGVVLLAALFALGLTTPLFELAYRWLPGFRWIRTPARAFLPASLAVAVLVGMGMQRLAEDPGQHASAPGRKAGQGDTLSHDQVLWSSPVALATGAFTLALGLGLSIFFGQANRATLGLAFFPSLTLLIAGLRVRRRLSLHLALPALVLLLFADLASFDRTLMRFASPAEVFADGAAVADYLADRPGLFRTYSPSYSLPSQVAARPGLQTADGVEPVHLSAYDRLMALAGGYGEPGFSVTIPPFPPDRSLTEAFQTTQPDLRLLGLLNVEYLVAAFPMGWPGLTSVFEVDGTFVYRNEHVLPRAWVIHPPLADATLVDFGGDWARQLAAIADQAAQSTAARDQMAKVTHYEPDRIQVEARLPEPGLLVLSEIWYPGWRAIVDGEARPVEPVAHILRGVHLAEGAHQVVFVYDPGSVRWGVRLSLAAIAGIIGWGGFTLWRWKRPRPAKAG